MAIPFLLRPQVRSELLALYTVDCIRRIAVEVIHNYLQPKPKFWHAQLMNYSKILQSDERFLLCSLLPRMQALMPAAMQWFQGFKGKRDSKARGKEVENKPSSKSMAAENMLKAEYEVKKLMLGKI